MSKKANALAKEINGHILDGHIVMYRDGEYHWERVTTPVEATGNTIEIYVSKWLCRLSPFEG